MNEPLIHPTAIVSDGATIDASVRIGPGAVIEADVRIGADTTIGPYAVVRQFTQIGRNNRIDAHVVLGGDPQHTAYDGSETGVTIGDGNVLREFVTIHRAYEPGAETRVGSNCFLMTAVHVGHDCIIGDNVILTNSVSLGGHVEVGDNAVMGGVSGAHQFTRIGRFCMVGAHAVLRKDALPYSLIGGEPVRHYRLNRIGLKRSGITGERYRALEAAFRALRSGSRSLAGLPDTDEVRYLRDWLAVRSKYGRYGFVSHGDSTRSSS